MKHIGIDLGSRKSHLCIRDAQAKIIEERVMATDKLGWWFKNQVEPGSKVIFETCNETFYVARQAQQAGLEARVVPSAVVRQLGVGYRGIKNDVRDARVLSRSSVALATELPTVHIPSQSSQSLQRLLSQRKALVRVRTSLINNVRAVLRSELIRIPSGASNTFFVRVRVELQNHPLLEVLEPMLSVLQSTQEGIEAMQSKIEQACKPCEQVRRLRTCPGVGLLTAAAWVSATDDLGRFPSASSLVSYIGLSPGENSTGGKTKLTSITKAGNNHLRTMLIQAAWVHVRTQQSALSERYSRLASAKPTQVAIVATARKLATILFAMMRNNNDYDPTLQVPSNSTAAEQVVTALAS